MYMYRGRCSDCCHSVDSELGSGRSKTTSGRKRDGEGTSSNTDDSTFASLSDDSRRLHVQCKLMTVSK